MFDFDSNHNAGWASDGFLADSIVDQLVVPGSQQQYFSRNSQYAGWASGVWNMVFVGDTNPPAGIFPEQPYTVVGSTPVMREKPYLYIDGEGKYNVFVPELQTNTQGVSWAGGATPGASVPIDQFYLADPDTSDAASINAALSQGKNLLFTPGVYHLNDTIRVTNPGTVVLGLAMPTLIPDNGKTAMSVADVDDVKIAGLLFDAGPAASPSLLEVGPSGSSNDHAAHPTSLHDLYFRTGGAQAGRVDVSLMINSSDVIGDHFWIRRADHGTGVGWDANVSKNGLVVNGNNVTVYGLFNEHHQEYQTLWNGNGGRVYFYQSEIPYDVPNQSAWMSGGGTVNGYASYKVADTVTRHEAWGLGVYSYFRDAAVKLNSSIEVPDVPGVNIHHATSIWLPATEGSEITHVINGIGGKVHDNSTSEGMRQTVNEFVGGTPDTQAPTSPVNVTATAVSDSEIDLSWTASKDNVNLAGYDIYRDGVPVAFTLSNSYKDMGLTAFTTYTYSLIAKDGAGNLSPASGDVITTTQKTALERTGWTAATLPATGENPANLLDDSLSTRWSSEQSMAPGQSITLDMKAPQTFSRLVMDSSGSSMDYARGYEMYISNDGVTWGAPVASGSSSGAVIIVDFPVQTAQYIEVVQTDTSPNWWSIQEVNVYK